MEQDKTLTVKSWLYDETEDEVQASIAKTEDPEILYLYAYNYNWDNGFRIPQFILDHKNCNLSIALLIFYRADGVSYLFHKSDCKNVPQGAFIKNLYDSIVDGKYQKADIEFRAPLSKVQYYKLKKLLTEREYVFIENISGKNLDIDL